MVLTCKRYLINLKIEASLLAKFFLSNPFMGNGKYNFLSKSLAKTRKKKKVILTSNNRHLRCDKYHLCNFFMSINISKYTIVQQKGISFGRINQWKFSRHISFRDVNEREITTIRFTQVMETRTWSLMSGSTQTAGYWLIY